MTNSQVTNLKLTKLKNLVYRITGVFGSKELRNWLKKNIEDLKQLREIDPINQELLPDLRYRESWEQIAIAVSELLQNSSNVDETKKWRKMSSSQLRKECDLRGIQWFNSGNQGKILTRSQMIELLSQRIKPAA